MEDSIISFPASKAILTAFAMPPAKFIAPCIIISSVIIRPLKPSSPRSISIKRYLENVAGSPLGKIDEKFKCPVIIAGTPASIRYLKGISSLLRKVSSDMSILGRRP